jgi:AmmeMemoRadiSam system protein A
MPQTDPPATWPVFARRVIESAVARRDAAQIPAPFPPTPHGGAFVTLHKFDRLRGCMGSLDATQPLAETIRHAAIMAATQDPRFAPVQPDELADITLDVSILTAPEPMQSLDDLEIGKHGIIVQRGQHRGLFLPQVATAHNMDKRTFLQRCCTEKARLPADAWEDPNTEVFIFAAQVLYE